MKIMKALLVGMFVLSIANSASAMNFDMKNVKAFGSIDMFSVGTIDDRADDTFKNEKNADATDLTNPGERSGRNGPQWGSYKLDTDAAYGFRLGALYPIEDMMDLGLSWGYISGPNTATTFNSVKQGDTNRRFYRFMLEGRKDIKYNDKFSFLGGAGLGWAFGRQEYEVVYAQQSIQNGVRIPSYDMYFNGLSWELSAGVNYKATDKLNVNAGVRYAGFPSAPHTIDHVSGNMEIPGFNYNALGFFVGASF